ncbi:uncharacterized protein LY89DRAFT_677770 [Mollisia scopiformis]|uniref:2EXR domain-containing protein n=1 Tax=Mollisia scopiformis TaxID=149040 RepID=A0A132B5M9_MOLSC|nr:uncharacterized protein LY89DRAFT_677770 [Mollisia scopiformis]KUJ07553.1 hypothetical protein LY89DRAFT_677770 [Mollisia scopiformis]
MLPNIESHEVSSTLAPRDILMLSLRSSQAHTNMKVGRTIQANSDTDPICSSSSIAIMDPITSPEQNEVGVVSKGRQLQTFDEFKFFPKLPVELRLKIWKAALPVPTTIHVCARLSPMHKASKCTLSYQGYAQRINIATLSNSGMSCTCHEARNAYVAAMPSTIDLINTLTGRSIVIRFGVDDTLYLFGASSPTMHDSLFWDFMSVQKWTKEVKMLKISLHWASMGVCKRFLACFEGLEKVELSPIRWVPTQNMEEFTMLTRWWGMYATKKELLETAGSGSGGTRNLSLMVYMMWIRRNFT